MALYRRQEKVWIRQSKACTLASGAKTLTMNLRRWLVCLSFVLVAPVIFPGSGATAPFRARSVRTGCNQPVTFEWTWGDGHAPATSPEICRSFPAAGDVTWQVRAVAGTTSKTLTGVVTVRGPVVPVSLAVTRVGNDVQITWPSTSVRYRLESVPYLGVTVWQTVAQTPVVVNGQFTVTVPATTTEQYFRLRQGP